jgi:signal transduction histidine kinase/CheY-like chemotaxis protein
MMTLRTGEPSLDVIMGVHKPDGTLTWISINALPIRTDTNETAHAVITTFHDVTALRAAQVAAERLARKEHLVTTGTLAAGVGHEINNPLTYILANIEFVMDELRAIAGAAPSGRLKDLVGVLNDARDGAERVKKIVRGLRALARDESEPIPNDIEAVVDIAINMAAHELRHKATVTKHMGATVPVLADESRLTQVLVNLLVNAAQAFRAESAGTNHVAVTSAREEDGRISITVSDNGPGMTPLVLQRIFDPFFTTKRVGEGTGLGLSISRSIVSALDGEIVAESVVGEGTTIQVRLPAGTHRLGAEAATERAEPTPRGRVLAIDDEPAILSALRRIVGRDHDVVAEADPRDALARLERGETFDVVFCDVAMPHLGGDALYRRARELDPELADRFVFVTGGALEHGARSFLAEVPNEQVEKPFSAQNMRGIVRRFVDARARLAAVREA